MTSILNEHPGISLLDQIWEMSRENGPDSVGIAALHEIWFSNYPTGLLRSDRNIGDDVGS